MDDAQILKLIDEKIIELLPLTGRMDDTKSLLEDEYTFTYGDQKVDEAITVTRNLAVTHADFITNKLSSFEWQIRVESSNKLPKTLVSKIESFSNDVWPQMDEFINNEHDWSGGLDAWNAGQLVRRGRTGARIWLYYKDDKLVIDCLPLDMRWCPSESGEWFCPITRRTAEQIKAHYNAKKLGKDVTLYEGGIPSGGTDLEVRNFWNNDKECVFVEKVKIAERNNVYKELPFVSAISSAGFRFGDKGNIEHQGESFDWKNRYLYKEADRAASMIVTSGFFSLFPRYMQSTKDNVSKPANQVGPPGGSQRVVDGEEFKKVETGDLNAAFIEGAREVITDIYAGGVTPMEAGQSEAPNTALMVKTVEGILGGKQKPYRDAMVYFKQAALRKIISQYIKLSKLRGEKVKETDLGIEGMTHRYSAEELGDPSTYRIRYIPKLNAKEVNIANTVTALGQRGFLPDRWILEHTMEAEDPDGIIRDMRIQKAEELDPATGMFETARSFARAAKDMTGEEADFANMESMYWTEMAVLRRRADKARIQMAMQPQTSEATPLPGGQREEVKPKGMTLAGGGNGGMPVAPQLEAKAEMAK